ncbi:hypothetical protein I204_00759 [Kwoniella mangroviensis CBS 8886]|uniref:uncharacterized protein n=1 Tax=Kwoniella mangroviensis CBS 8507 TaxID=1296122 RepID=UPI00080CE9C8|nr:uncharacterized protein I203_05714 [Kwoniella mangroviensis CBS 8507]OCF64972.1 hypothetical protein I203_05714 [Kwoniella mangroviensis CBS 8507]OCF78815.1 hypothetical protein I204_00759 [Kwoniella mangroviensis CBS 8886]
MSYSTRYSSTRCTFYPGVQCSHPECTSFGLPRYQSPPTYGYAPPPTVLGNEDAFLAGFAQGRRASMQSNGPAGTSEYRSGSSFGGPQYHPEAHGRRNSMSRGSNGNSSIRHSPMPKKATPRSSRDTPHRRPSGGVFDFEIEVEEMPDDDVDEAIKNAADRLSNMNMHDDNRSDPSKISSVKTSSSKCKGPRKTPTITSEPIPKGYHGVAFTIPPMYREDLTGFSEDTFIRCTIKEEYDNISDPDAYWDAVGGKVESTMGKIFGPEVTSKSTGDKQIKLSYPKDITKTEEEFHETFLLDRHTAKNLHKKPKSEFMNTLQASIKSDLQSKVERELIDQSVVHDLEVDTTKQLEECYNRFKETFR